MVPGKMEEREGAEGREACKKIPVTVLEQDDKTTVRQQKRVWCIARNPK